MSYLAIPGLEPLHWLIAYAGLAVHVLLKLAEAPGGIFDSFTKRDILTTIASVIAIPAILIVCTDTALKEILPINYVTAFLAGYQTQSFLRSISSISERYKSKG